MFTIYVSLLGEFPEEKYGRAADRLIRTSYRRSIRCN